jgi:hypothetical protein
MQTIAGGLLHLQKVQHADQEAMPTADRSPRVRLACAWLITLVLSLKHPILRDYLVGQHSAQVPSLVCCVFGNTEHP